MEYLNSCRQSHRQLQVLDEELLLELEFHLQNLQNHLMLFFTGFSRTASDIAKEQIKKTPEKKKELHRHSEGNILKSRLIILGKENKRVKNGVVMPDVFLGLDGMHKYFETTLAPLFDKVKKEMIQIQRKIVIPEIEE